MEIKFSERLFSEKVLGIIKNINLGLDKIGKLAIITKEFHTIGNNEPSSDQMKEIRRIECERNKNDLELRLRRQLL